MFYSPSENGFFDQAVHGLAIPSDAVAITREEHSALLAGQSLGKRIVPGPSGKPVLSDPPAMTEEQIIAVFVAEIQRRLDAFARTRGYDSILSAATYATSAVQRFSVEGRYAVDARDATWAAAYQILDQVKNGERDMPSIDDVISELPLLQWPAV